MHLRRLLRTRPLASSFALAALLLLGLAVAGRLASAGADAPGHPEGTNGVLGALYEDTSAKTSGRPLTLRLTLRRLPGAGAPYAIVARGTLTRDGTQSIAYFHAGHARLVDAAGRPVAGCDNATVDAFTTPRPPDTAGGDGWGLRVGFPPDCTAAGGAYQESDPMPEPAALTAWR